MYTLWDYKCETCEHVFERLTQPEEEVICPQCNGPCYKTITEKAPNRDWFRPHWNENIDYDPVYVETKQQYKDLLLKNGLTSRALGDIRNITEI